MRRHKTLRLEWGIRPLGNWFDRVAITDEGSFSVVRRGCCVRRSGKADLASGLGRPDWTGFLGHGCDNTQIGWRGFDENRRRSRLSPRDNKKVHLSFVLVKGGRLVKLKSWLKSKNACFINQNPFVTSPECPIEHLV